MVYGMVMYDFAAERPDELEAKAGEAIIVIAQSNPEWFVAKPIGRLGGPGLIPVSFIEIRDMSTGKAVSDAQEAVQRAGVPKVEEWKKMAADYKNSSITLGKFETAQAQQQSLEQGMNRMSLQQGPRASQQAQSNYVSLLVCCDKQRANGWKGTPISTGTRPSTQSAISATTTTTTKLPTIPPLPTSRMRISAYSSVLLRRGQVLVRR